MSHDLWQQLAQLCGNEIPREYRRLLQAYPQSLRRVQRSEDGSDAEGCVGDVELLADLSEVLAINREARASPVPDPAGNKFSWPAQLLVIGESGTGDYFCIDTSDDSGEVQRYLHCPNEFELVADSLAEFVEMLEEAFGVLAGEGRESEDTAEL